MTARPAFSLLEVLLACVLLAAVTIACLPMMRYTEPTPRIETDPRLGDLVRTNPLIAPPNTHIETFPSLAGSKTEGRWIVAATPGHYAIVWVPVDPGVEEGTP